LDTGNLPIYKSNDGNGAGTYFSAGFDMIGRYIIAGGTGNIYKWSPPNTSFPNH